jgi:hypothetical protein
MIPGCHPSTPVDDLNPTGTVDIPNSQDDIVLTFGFNPSVLTQKAFEQPLVTPGGIFVWLPLLWVFSSLCVQNTICLSSKKCQLYFQ